MNKNDLVNLIVTNDRGKRVIGFVQELFLEKFIIPRMDHATVSLGWCYEKSKRTKWKRHWYRILPDSESLTDRDFTIAENLSRVDGDRVFCAVVSSRLSGEVCEVIVTRKLFSSDGLQAELDSDSSQQIFRLPIDHFTPSRDVATCLPYLLRLDDAGLLRLLSTRVVMNMFLRASVDIDAIFQNSQGRWFFLEYKRKDPMDGYYPFRGNTVLNFIEVRKLQKELREELKSKGYSEKCPPRSPVVSSIFRDILKTRPEWGTKLHFEWMPLEAFGLDTSHADNVSFTRGIEHRYVYLIWNQSPQGGITSILSPNLLPIVKPKFMHIKLDPNLYAGVNFTVNSDSGSFDEKTRLQLCIPVCKFTDSRKLIENS